MNEQVTLDLILQLTKKTEESVNKALDKIEGDASKKSDTMGTNIGTRLAGAITAVLSAISLQKVMDFGKDTIKTFQDIEDQVADVAKTVGFKMFDSFGKMTGAAKDFKNEIFELSKTTRSSINDLLTIATIGGQFGVAQKDIVAFTKSIDTLNVALGDEFTGGAEEITKAISEMGNVFKEFKGADGKATTDSLLKIGNALNFLGAEGSATAPVVTEFATRIGGAGSVLGITAAQALGFGAALQELAVAPERGSSAVVRILQKMAKTPEAFASVVKMSTAEFTKIVNTDINQALILVSKAIAGGGVEATSFAAKLDELGLDGVYTSEILAKLGTNTEFLTKKQQDAANALQNTSSIMDEYNTKNNTAAARAQKFRNQVDILKESIGAALQPVLDAVMGPLTKILEGFGKWAAENPKMVQTVFGLAGAIGVLGAAMGAINFLGFTSGAGGAGLSIAALWKPFALLGGWITGLPALFGGAFASINVFMTLLPGMIMSGFQFITGGGLLALIQGGFAGVMSFFAGLPAMLFGFIGSIPGMIAGAFAALPGILAGLAGMILPVVLAIGAIGLVIFTVIAAFQEFQSNAAKFQPIIDLLKSIFDQLVTALTNVWNYAMQQFNPLIERIRAEVLPALGVAFYALLKVIEFLVPFVEPIFKFFVNIIVTAVNMVIDIFSGLVNVFKGVFQVIQGLFSGDGQKVREGFLNIFNGIAQAVGGIFKGVINTIIDVINLGINAVNILIDKLPDFNIGGFSKANLKIPEIRKFATGGDFIVPPGYPNDSYLMGVQSGERVKVTPSNQVSNDNREYVQNNYGTYSRPLSVGFSF
jgi:TP901 family phage tail tape measure protein